MVKSIVLIITIMNVDQNTTHEICWNGSMNCQMSIESAFSIRFVNKYMLGVWYGTDISTLFDFINRPPLISCA